LNGFLKADIGASAAKANFVRSAELYAKRSEGPLPAHYVEMCMVQQSDRSLSHYCHYRRRFQLVDATL
jgi:hypothetical protein